MLYQVIKLLEIAQVTRGGRDCFALPDDEEGEQVQASWL
jgi:hypothetical protein